MSSPVNNSFSLPNYTELTASLDERHAPAHTLLPSRSSSASPPPPDQSPASGTRQAMRAASMHPAIAAARNRTSPVAGSSSAAQTRASTREALFRPPQDIADAHDLLEALGLATHDGTVQMQEYRERADQLMTFVQGVQQQHPNNEEVTRSSHAFIMSRAEGDVQSGDSVDDVMARYRFAPNDLGMRRRLEDAQQQPEDNPFAFSPP